MSARDVTSVAVSAPGKVLLAGGYLVLDRRYTGLVCGLSARIHVIVEPLATQSGVSLSEVIVKSPQFEHAIWEYGYCWSNSDQGMSVTQLRTDANLKLSPNPFVETALGYALTYIASVSSPHLSPAAVTILADNDYYSNDPELSHGSSHRFFNFGVPLQEAHKTGLGSSAALVTALTAALLTHYLSVTTFDVSSEQGKRCLHNLAQAAHCAAQGKVGSGFDIASAVYGSCLYRRFSPQILAEATGLNQPGFATSLSELVDSKRWDTEIFGEAVKLPKGYRLVMCDVFCGSQTPGMVKQVLAWRKAHQAEADQLWDGLGGLNESLATHLSQWAEGEISGLQKVQHCFPRIREKMQIMSEKTGVPIEPPQQTLLLNACEKIQGVVGGVVPGAGGYDAIVLLIEDTPETEARLKALFADWKFESESGGGKVSMLGVKQEMEGVRAESPGSYTEWLNSKS